MARGLLFICVLFVGLPAFANSYGRESGKCQFYGYSEDINVRPHPMPLHLTATMSVEYVIETAEVVRHQFDGWTEDPGAKIHLDPQTLNRLNEWSFYLNRSTKEIWMYHFQAADWLNLLQYLSQSQLSLKDPYTFGDLAWMSLGHGTWTEKFSPVLDSKFAFPIEGTGTENFIMQIHLPTSVKNGLSFHLQGSCAFETVP